VGCGEFDYFYVCILATLITVNLSVFITDVCQLIIGLKFPDSVENFIVPAMDTLMEV